MQYNRSVTVLKKCSNRTPAFIGNINLYFLFCVLIIDACFTKKITKQKRWGMSRLTTEERGRAVGMVSVGCSFREVSKNVNNFIITGDFGHKTLCIMLIN